MISKVEATRKHLHQMVSLYGEQRLVNLVNHKGHEKPVKDAYERYVSEVSAVDKHKSSAELLHRPTFQTSDMNTLTSIRSARTCASIV